MMYKNVLFGTVLTVSISAGNLHSAEETNAISNEATPGAVMTNVEVNAPSEKAVLEAAQIIADALVNSAEADIKVADVVTEERKEIVESELMEGETEEKAAVTEKVVENVKIIAETIIKVVENAGIDITNIAAAVVEGEKKEVAEGVAEALVVEAATLEADRVVEDVAVVTEEIAEVPAVTEVVADRTEVALEVVAIEPALVVESDKIEADELVKSFAVFDIEVGNVTAEERSETVVAETKIVEVEIPNAIEDMVVKSFEPEVEAIIQIPENFSVRPAYVAVAEKKALYETSVKTKVEIVQDDVVTLETSEESFGFKVAKTLAPVLGVALIVYAIVKLTPSIIS